MRKICDQCDHMATHHTVEVVGGQKIHKHLCEEHAELAGLTNKRVVNRDEMISTFLKRQKNIKKWPVRLVLEYRLTEEWRCTHRGRHATHRVLDINRDGTVQAEHYFCDSHGDDAGLECAHFIRSRPWRGGLRCVTVVA